MRVVGTAGHVDHGKSTLVKALTGINPDRLREEQEREMTIELGFAWMVLPGDIEVGIVDVPGHRDFIDNMLAGVGGIDAVVFVIAADEGVMPQTREHLAIINLLQIPEGVIALTKCDMVDDPAWLDLVEEDIQKVTQGTVLENAAIMRVSAKTGKGLEELRLELARLLQEIPERPDLHRPRLSIDRIFSLMGFGTVVTGTLLDGKLRIGDEMVILPQGIKARVRGLQTHKRKVESILPGSRAAVNVTGVDVEQIKRGDILAAPDKYMVTSRMDAQVNVLVDASSALKHDQEMKFYIGAKEALTRIRVLGKDEIRPAETGWVQLEFKEPVVAVRGDRFIIRRPSPGETVGGGFILDPHPKQRHKRFQQEVLDTLAIQAQGNPEDLLHQTALKVGITDVGKLFAGAKLGEETARPALTRLVEDQRVIILSDAEKPAERILAANEVVQSLLKQVQRELQQYHQSYSLRHGMPREALKSRLKLGQREFTALITWMVHAGILKGETTWLALPEFTIVLSRVQKQSLSQLLDRFASAPFNPPGVKECLEQVGGEMMSFLQEDGILMKVSDDVVFRVADYRAMQDWVANAIETEGSLTVASFRDHFQTSRKYALAMLEHLDTIGFTQRDGDVRRLRGK
ncbi:MAG: selenocysteine-specific translation elongation factor [Anaerolineaceae bacterium]